MSRSIPFGKLSARMLRFWVEADLKGSEWLVFMALHAHAEWGGRVYLSHKKMAERIGMRGTHFSTALKRLESVGVVSRFKGFVQISPLLMEYGDWAGAKEVSQRKARRESCFDMEQERREAGISGADTRGSEVDGGSIQRGPLSFPEVPVSTGKASG